MNWANSFLKSPICQVEFLGFMSDTLKLARAGWAISAQQDYHYHGVSLAFKHEVARLYAITDPMDSSFLFRLSRINDSEMEKLLQYTVFQVKWMSTQPIIEVMRPQAYQWSAIDPFPSLEYNSDKRQIEDLIPFKTIRPDAPEIIIAPESIAELMEKIIKLQDPKQKEIRDRQRKEAWRNGPGSQSFNGYNPSSNIQAQIISLVG